MLVLYFFIKFFIMIIFFLLVLDFFFQKKHALKLKISTPIYVVNITHLTTLSSKGSEILLAVTQLQ